MFGSCVHFVGEFCWIFLVALIFLCVSFVYGLVQQYGLFDAMHLIPCVVSCLNGCSVAFQVVEQGMFVKHCKVEVYLTELKLCEDSNMDNMITRRFSKADTIGRAEAQLFHMKLARVIALIYILNTFV